MERKRFKIGQRVRFKTKEEMPPRQDCDFLEDSMSHLYGIEVTISGYGDYRDWYSSYTVYLTDFDYNGDCSIDWHYCENMLVALNDEVEQEDDDEPMNFGEAIDKIGETFARICKEAGIDFMSIDYHKGRWFCSDVNGELFAGGKVKD